MHKHYLQNLVIVTAAAAALLSFTVAGSSSAGTIGAPAGAAVTVIGHIDTAPLVGRSVTVNGWSIDRLNTSGSNSVQLVIDGQPVGSYVSANIKNAGVNARNRVSGNHGFTLKANLTDGNHAVCVRARGIGRPVVAIIGCTPITVDLPSTEIQMRAQSAKIDATHTVSWLWQTGGTEAGGAGVITATSQITIAPGTKTSILRSVMLHEYARILQFRAYGNDKDVTSAFNALDGHAGATTLLSVQHGADCVAAALGSIHLSYGCPGSLVTIAASIANGTTFTKTMAGVISVTGSGRTFTVGGWAFDPIHPTKASSVLVTDNGVALTAKIPADQPSAGINAFYGISGNHGWNLKVSLAAGFHNICLIAYRTTANQPSRQIICVITSLPSDASKMPAVHRHS